MARRKVRVPVIEADTPKHVRMLAAIREKRGWSQAQLGAVLNVSGRTVRHWERQRTKLKSAWMIALRELLETSYAEEISHRDA